ncbi:hypothetical protein ABXS69_04735 [Actinomyces timonensis]|uniref:Uncharacterized protein n=1 Tax=Actinomyces timonensis TaxID=1288391 RepID=A0AAU8N496_9ACTO
MTTGPSRARLSEMVRPIGGGASSPPRPAPAAPERASARPALRALAWLWVPISPVIVGLCLVLDGLAGWLVVSYLLLGYWIGVLIYRLVIAILFHISTRRAPERPVPRWLVAAVVAQELALDLAAFLLPDADDARTLSILQAWGVPEAIGDAIVDALLISALIGALLLLAAVAADLFSARERGGGASPRHPSDTTG